MNVFAVITLMWVKERKDKVTNHIHSKTRPHAPYVQALQLHKHLNNSVVPTSLSQGHTHTQTGVQILRNTQANTVAKTDTLW